MMQFHSRLLRLGEDLLRWKLYMGLVIKKPYAHSLSASLQNNDVGRRHYKEDFQALKREERPGVKENA